VNRAARFKRRERKKQDPRELVQSAEGSLIDVSHPQTSNTDPNDDTTPQQSS